MKRRTIPLLLAMCLWAPSALGDDRADAETLHKQGVEMMKKGKFAEAAASFRASYAKDQSPRELYNAARAELAQGKHAAAAKLYRTYLGLPNNNQISATERAEAQQELAEITKHLCTLDVRAPKFTVDGSSYDGGLVDVEAGEHKVEMSGPSGAKVKVVRGEKGVTILVEYVEPEKTKEPPPGPITPPPKVEMEKGSWVVPGVLAGVGVVGIGVGIGLGAATSSKEAFLSENRTSCGADGASCPQNRDAYDSWKTLGTGAIVSYAVGGAAVVGAVIATALLRPWEERPVGRAPGSVSPWLGNGTSGVIVQGGF